MSERRLISFDWAIKRLLRSKANFEILEGFLSELLREDVTIISLLESETNKETQSQKQSRLDLKVKNSKNEFIIVEIQYETEYDFLQRVLFSTSKTITENLEVGSPYSDVVKVYSINILYFDFGHGEDYIYHGNTVFKGLYKNDVLQLNERQKKFFDKEFPQQIFPEYYLIKINNFNNVAKNTLDEWVYFLKNEKVKSEFTAKGLKKAIEELDILKLSVDERRAYERYSDDLHYQASMVQSSFGVGQMEGFQKGLKKGLKKGVRKGRQDARKEMLQTVKNLIAMKLSLESIAQATGLSFEEVKKINDGQCMQNKS
ncbi:MAG: Rpn family recombination-promoting nuclease/putative transposase [Candidatus Riflebacteria bacterium]|nr:Rpn family recombination-promoting nuclease/putative transposase [Candidatus Riflebacteria bacterium]